MTNWKKYKITNRDNNSRHSNWIRFYLDDYVIYNDGFYGDGARTQSIDCKKIPPFSEWCTGDYIEINNDKTRYMSRTHNFDNTEQWAIRFASSNSKPMVLVRAKTEISSNNKDYKIGESETSLGKTQEKNFQYKLRQQEEELEKFIQEQGINRKKVWDLRKAYQKLIQSRENYNQMNIDEARESIEKIKDELLKGGWFTKKVSVDNVQKLCRDCEKIAKLTIEQDKFYQAQQEVPPRSS